MTYYIIGVSIATIIALGYFIYDKTHPTPKAH